jgi:arginine-tRNA-protein transferase
MHCRTLPWGPKLRTAVWIRLPARDPKLRRSTRRLANRNDARFTSAVARHQWSEEKEAVFQAYQAIAPGGQTPSIDRFLLGRHARDRFDTHEVTIRDGDRLVGFSLFDVGLTSAQSLIGCYLPDYARFGLGRYSLLLELRHLASRGGDYHYPGYILRDEPVMDYKLLCDAEFLDLDRQRWAPLTPESELPSCAEQTEAALLAVQALWQARGRSTELRTYGPHDLPAWNANLSNCLDEPLVLDCGEDNVTDVRLLVAWRIHDRRYRLLRVVPGRLVYRTEAPDSDTNLDVSIVVSEHGPFEAVDEVLRALVFYSPKDLRHGRIRLPG